MPSLSREWGDQGRENKTRQCAQVRGPLSPPSTDIVSATRHVRKVPILLQKSFSGDERNFLGLLMRFVCGDVRDLIVSHKTDHGPPHRRYRALQQWRRLKICLGEIFGIAHFRLFPTNVDLHFWKTLETPMISKLRCVFEKPSRPLFRPRHTFQPCIEHRLCTVKIAGLLAWVVTSLICEH